jgi:hypothetical protein
VSYCKDNSFFEQLIGSIKKAFESKESEKLLPDLYAMEVVVSQDLSKVENEAVAKVRQGNFVMLMELLMHSIKTQSQYWNVFVTLLDFLIKLANRTKERVLNKLSAFGDRDVSILEARP